MAGNVCNSSTDAECSEYYRNDERPACRYGKACYQKNSTHVNKYKHPPKVVNATRKNVATSERTARKYDNSRSSEKGEAENDDTLEVPSKRFKKDGNPSPSKNSVSSGSSSSKTDTRLHQESKANSSVQEISLAGSVEVQDYDAEPEMPPSPLDVRESIKQKFLFEMPEDFYSFWELCKSLHKENPASAFKTVGLELVGPYSVLSGALKVPDKKRKQSLFLLHWRYYYDPPEFQTVLKGDEKRQFHIGYFRDEPQSLPVFLASNCAAKDGLFTPIAENIFGAVNAYLVDLKKSGNPFLHSKIPKLHKPLQEWAKENGYTLDTRTQGMKERGRKVVSKTFHGLGLVVPVEKKTEMGYRELIETDANLKRILHQITTSSPGPEKDLALDKLTPIITAANIANDECDFGTSVELGLDLFSYGGADLERSALQLLSTGYNLLRRKEFALIAKVHLSNRRKDPISTAFN